MRRRRKTDEFAETLLVTTDDGKTFRCVIGAAGHETEPRWVLMDEQAEQYIGPPVLPDHSPEAVKAQIAEWWANRTGPVKAEPKSKTAEPGEPAPGE